MASPRRTKRGADAAPGRSPVPVPGAAPAPGVGAGATRAAASRPALRRTPALVPTAPLDERLRDVLDSLRRHASEEWLTGYARFGIVVTRAFGVPMAAVQATATPHRRDHELAQALWDSGWYEARLAAAYVGDPAQVTPAQMDRWARDFDNWGICDTVCFALFDGTPHALAKIREWADAPEEFVRRAAFALLASVALHRDDVTSDDLRRLLPLCERASTDERNFVKKAVSWALRAIGGRRADLHADVLVVAQRLADSPDRTSRWIGRDVLRDVTRPLVLRRLGLPR